MLDGEGKLTNINKYKQVNSMVAAAEAALDPVIRRGKEPLRLVELCTGKSTLRWRSRS